MRASIKGQRIAIAKPFDIKKLSKDGFEVSNDSIDYLMQKVGQDIAYKEIMKKAKPFTTKLSIANVEKIIDVSRPNSGPV